jgi:hypothetical protein
LQRNSRVAEFHALRIAATAAAGGAAGDDTGAQLARPDKSITASLGSCVVCVVPRSFMQLEIDLSPRRHLSR